MNDFDEIRICLEFFTFVVKTVVSITRKELSEVKIPLPDALAGMWLITSCKQKAW